jgi:hypothetical protein
VEKDWNEAPSLLVGNNPFKKISRENTNSSIFTIIIIVSSFQNSSLSTEIQRTT